METYHGHVRTPADAIILFEACRIGLLPRVQRRLSEKERQSIKSGSVFVWDEREAGMRRWTDGKSWSASRVSGSFLTYREMEGKRGGGFDKTQNRESVQANNDPDSDGGPDGYRYKVDGLIKQSFSITTNNGQHLHLISYFSRSSATAQNLTQPTNDPQLRHIRPEKGMYPESTVHEQSNIPAVTRGPMNSPGYSQPSQHPPYASAAPYPYPHPQHPHWAPPSPMHTPPPNYSQYAYHHHHHPPSHHPGYPHPSSMQHMQYPPHPPYHGAPQQHLHATNFDRPPPHLQSTLPPPPPPGYPAYPPGHYPPTYQNGYGPYPPPGPMHATHQYPPPSHHAPQPYHTGPPSHYPPAPDAQGQAKRDSPQPSRPSSFISTSAPGQGIKSEKRERSTSDSQPTTSAPPVPPAAASPPSSGQTIPSISAMLNGRDGGVPPIRSSSRSPNNSESAPKGPSDIPSHKLGFEANRDMEALRNLDKTTFKGY